MRGGGCMGGGGGSSPATTPFISPLPIPPLLTPTVKVDPTFGEFDYYAIEAKAATKQFIPGLQTTIWGYNGMFPGPAIKARSGRPVKLRVTNRLPENIVVHLHGGHVSVTDDGHAMDYILPGNAREYFYPNNQQASTIWYHDHAMGITGPHVWKGLFAPYIIEDDFERGLPLPTGPYDLPLIVQDRLFKADGSFNYPQTQRGMMQSGAQGDVMLVNGSIQPYLQVATRKYRFRILNGSNARLMELALNTGQPFVQIGSDGGLLPAPVVRSTLLISPGERVEVVVDFSAYKTGTQVVLKNLLGSGRTLDVMRFDVNRKETDTALVPASLRPIQRFSPAISMRTRTFTLGMNMSGYTINGLTYDHMRVDATPTLDTVETWEFVNPMMGMWHCMHTHDIMWQVLDRDGAAPPAHEAGWKDTWYIPGGSRVRVIGKFADYGCCPDPMMYLENYMLHCHILEHDDNGMMAQFKVIDPGM